MTKNVLLPFLIFPFLSGCSHMINSQVEFLAKKTVQDVACKNKDFESRFWDGLKSYLIDQKQPLSVKDLKSAIHQKVIELGKQDTRVTAQILQEINFALDKLINDILVEAPAGEGAETAQQLLGMLSGLDVGDRSTDFRSYIQDKIRADFLDVSEVIQKYDLTCPQIPGGESDTVAEATVNPEFERLKQQAIADGIPLAVLGENWTFATAYQSCQTLVAPVLTSQTGDIQGISIVGKHPDGIGNKRVIGDLDKVQTTHPYIKDVSGYDSKCFNVRRNPLIYDYGGKPFATMQANSPLDLFKNNGDGTQVLGIDCSGYVYTAMAAAGLKFKAGRPLKASDSWAWGSTSYLEPENNGMTCLKKIAVSATASLMAGDIVAVRGHVILVNKVGEDPFGIHGAKTPQDCETLTSKNFDFVIAQSSPSVGGVGINHFEAREYLPTSLKMNDGLQKYAYYACLAKINNKTYTPNLGTLSVIRHKGTAECMAPRVNLVREECIQSCRF